MITPRSYVSALGLQATNELACGLLVVNLCGKDHFVCWQDVFGAFHISVGHIFHNIE